MMSGVAQGGSGVCAWRVSPAGVGRGGRAGPLGAGCVSSPPWPVGLSTGGSTCGGRGALLRGGRRFGGAGVGGGSSSPVGALCAVSVDSSGTAGRAAGEGDAGGAGSNRVGVKSVGEEMATAAAGELLGGAPVLPYRAKVPLKATAGPFDSWATLTYDEKLEAAYEYCGQITAHYAKTFFLGTKLMPTDKKHAVWAIYVWCRRTDELVDGPNAMHITPAALDRWEERLEAAFAGRPYDMLDLALTDTIAKFPDLEIQPFRDMITGMRMDLRKSRYHTFEELYEYCYCVAGTVGAMCLPVMGTIPGANKEQVLRAAIGLGIANQLTNILRDVGEDLRTRDRIYVPIDEMARFGYSEEKLKQGIIDDSYRAYTDYLIDLAFSYFKDAEDGVNLLSESARWPVWSALLIYRDILNKIKKNGYNNFTDRAYVTKHEKFIALPGAFLKAREPVPPAAHKP